MQGAVQFVQDIKMQDRLIYQKICDILHEFGRNNDQVQCFLNISKILVQFPERNTQISLYCGFNMNMFSHHDKEKNIHILRSLTENKPKNL